jgi:WD40 repeat protein
MSAEDPISPFKGLSAFDDSELDALLFFGREREREIVVANLIASRLTVLYGPSGVGKSSLLRAAVARSLRQLPEEPLVVVFSRWSDDPAAALADAVAEAGGGSTSGSPLESLDRAQSGRDVYLMLDQAEEYFLYHADDAGPGSFAEALPALLTTPVRINVLVSLREDALAKLDRFTGRIPGLFANTLRLDRLDRQAARAAIVRPVERFAELTGHAVTVEPELVERVLDEVGAGRIDPALGGLGAVEGAEDGARIEAPYLQLVMQRLWDEERAAGSDVLRVGTLERLGGAGHIVEEHLEGAMSELTAEQKDVAARLFNHLVTPSGTKIAHEVSDLADFGQVPVDVLRPVLASLAERRILRSLEEGGGMRYEIFHDVLAQPVLAWRADHRTAREIERQLTESHRRRRRLQLLFGLVLLAFALMAGVALFALDQRDTAQKEASRAKGRELAASAIAELAVDPQLSVLLASEAARRAPSPQIEDVLRRSLEASKLRFAFEAEGPVHAVGYSPDGSYAVVAGEAGRARVFDALSGEPGAELVHGGPVLEAWFAPDGRTVLTASEDGTARIWDATSGEERHVFEHDGPLASARFSADGEHVATAGADGVARIWRTVTGRLVRALRHDGPVLSAVFSPDGKRLATVAERKDERVSSRVFDARTGRRLYAPDQIGVTTADFSPDSRLLVTTSSDRTARLWRATDGKLLHVLDQPDGHVVGADFSPDGTQLVTASDGGTARVWDVATGGRLLVLVGPTNPVESASFSSDGQFLVVASLDRTVRVYRADNGLQAAVLLGHEDGVTTATFSPDGRRVLTASLDGTARLWDPGTANALQLVGDHDLPVAAAALSPDGRLAVSGDGSGAIGVWDLERRIRVHRFHVQSGVYALTFSPDGRSVAAAGVFNRVGIWDVQSGRRVGLLQHSGVIRRLAYSDDGEMLLAAGGPIVRVWAGDGRLILDLRTEFVRTADIAGSGTHIVTAGHDGIARVWDVETGELLHELEGHEDAITHVAFDPSGRLIVSAGLDDAARLWDVETGELLHVFDGHADDVLRAEFSRDGSLVATASLDGDGGIWDVETGESRHVLRGHFNPVYTIGFDPTDRWILTGSQRTAGLWPVSSGLLAAYLRGHETPVTTAEFASTGWRVLTASEDGTVRTWVCETCGRIEELLALADERLAATRRVLTPEERELYLG